MIEITLLRMKITVFGQQMLEVLKYAVLLFLLTICSVTCKKESIPIVNTFGVSSITRNTAVSGGKVTDDGGAEVISRGVCWSKSHNPTDTSSITSDGAGMGTFTSNLTGLTPGTTYYVMAYAVNSEGTAYGNEVSFTSSPIIMAELTKITASSVTSSSAVSGGNITSDGGGTITAKGVCWSLATNPVVMKRPLLHTLRKILTAMCIIQSLSVHRCGCKKTLKQPDTITVKQSLL